MTKRALYKVDATKDIHAFLAGTPFDVEHAQKLIADVCHRLLFHREEGQEVAPEFIFTTRHDRTQLHFTDGIVHELATGLPLSPTPDLDGKRVLKKLALLSNGGWFPCVEVTTDWFRFFIGYVAAAPGDRPRRVSAFVAHGTKRRREEEDILIVTRLRPGEVLLRLSGWQHDLRLVANPALEAPADEKDAVTEFVRAASVDKNFQTQSFATRLMYALTEALADSHGAMMVVAPHTTIDASLDAFKTGFVRLDPPIDLVCENARGLLRGTPEGDAKLQSIIRALTQFDGVIVLGSDFTVHAYGALVATEGAAAGSGGARSAALQALRSLHAKKFRAVLFRSQDGSPQLYKLDAPPGPPPTAAMRDFGSPTL